MPHATTAKADLLPRAAFRPGPSFHYAKDQDAAGAGDVDKPDDKGDDGKSKDKGKPAPTPSPEEEIERRAEEKAQAKLAAEREKDRKKAEKEKADAYAEEAKKRGEWEKLATREKEQREEAEARAVRAERSEQVNDALVDAAAEHEGYSVKVFKTYVKPIVMSELADDAKPEDLVKLTKAKVAEYVKDNPRAVKAGGGATVVVAGTRTAAKTTNGNNQPKHREPTVASSRF
jgi:hypothetical protein